MNRLLLKIQPYCIGGLLLLFFNKHALAQVCNIDSSYYSIHYRSATSTNNYFITGTVTPQNEVIGLGFASPDGNFISKFTTQGAVLWSNQYRTNYKLVTWMQFPWYTGLKLSNIAVSPDGSGFVTGVVTEHGETINNGETPPPHLTGVLMKLDKFGNIIFGKTLGAWGTNYSIDNVLALANGDILVYLTSYASTPVNRIVRLNQKGDIIWATSLLTQWQCLAGATHALKELSNGDIVAADEVYRDQDEVIPRGTFIPPVIIPPPIYYLNLFGLDKASGKITWNTNYRYAPDSSFIPKGFVPDIKHIAQLPNGNLSFMANLYVTATNNLIKYTQKAVNIITDKTGNLINVVGYNLTDNPCQLINVQDAGNNGEQILLTKDSIFHQSTLTQIDQNGAVQWSKAYANPDPQFAPQYFLKNTSAAVYYTLLGKEQSPELQLLVSNKSGNVPCLDAPAQMIAENDTWQWELNKISFSNITVPIDFGTHVLEMANDNYPLLSAINCQGTITCCHDIIDSGNVTAVSLCPGSNYTLPDGTKVQQAGKYYSTFTTLKGCDSTVFFQLSTIKSPQDLQLVTDTCFNGRDTLILHATDSFLVYKWMNTATTSSTYAVTKPGLYWVSVTNTCGSKTDSVQVYDNCSFPIYMPNAFTPNQDGKNDVFRVPLQNKNKLVRLSIFNRYGQVVYTTTNSGEGWDGTAFNNQPQPGGVYVYYLIMEDLLGNKLQQKGSLLLLR